VREYALVLLATAVVAYVLTPLVRRFALAIGAAPQVRDRDVHRVPIPRMGGLAMYAGLAGGLLMAHEMPRLKTVFEGPAWQGLLLAGGLITLIGVIDDRWGMGAFPKFAGQVAAAGILVQHGVQVQSLALPGTTLLLGPQQGTVLTVLLVVVTINAVNFIDGLDGLAAGVTAIAALAFLAYSYALYVVNDYQSHQTDSAMISALLAGMCLGFLPHNFNPARIFMGDTGSMLLGLMLASCTITVTGIDTNLTISSNLPTYLPLLLPIAVLALPILDLVLAVVRRTSAGLSPFAPDKKHLHHRLLAIGHSQRHAVLLMYLWTGLLGTAMASLALFSSQFAVLSVGGFAVLGTVLLITLPRIRGRSAGRRSREHAADRAP